MKGAKFVPTKSFIHLRADFIARPIKIIDLAKLSENWSYREYEMAKLCKDGQKCKNGGGIHLPEEYRSHWVSKSQVLETENHIGSPVFSFYRNFKQKLKI